MMTNRFGRIVSALTYSVLTERCGWKPSARVISPNRIVSFILGQHGRMPDFLRAPMLVATLLLDVWAIPFTGRAFHRLPHTERWKIILSWKSSRQGYRRDLVRFYESLAIFGWYSELERSGALGEELAPQDHEPTDASASTVCAASSISATLRTTLILLTIALSVFLLRLPSVFRPTWNMDEGTNACIADVILDGGMPFRDAIEHKPPVTYYAYAAGFALFGRNNMLAIHLLLCLLVAVIGGVVFAIARLAAGDRCGLLAAALFAVLSCSLFAPMDLMAAHTEWFLILFTCLGSYFFLRVWAGANGWLLLGSGCCYGLAMLSKQPAALDVLAAFGFLLFLSILRGRSWPRLVFRAGLLGIGCVLPMLATVLYFYHREALEDLIFWVWTYNTKYYVPTGDPSDRLKPVFVIARRLTIWFFPVMILCVAGVYRFTRAFFGARRDCKEDYGLFFVMWTVLSVTGASLSGRGFGHYFIQAIPGLALLAAAMLETLLSSTPRTLAHRLRLVAIGAACMLALPMGARLYQSFSRSERPERELVSYLKAISGEQERIFVWGFYPEIYVLADRMPVSRYVYCNFLTGLIPWTNAGSGVDTSQHIVPGSWDNLMEELHRRLPVCIVDTSPGGHRAYGKYPPSQFPRLDGFLGRFYRQDRVIRDEHGGISFVVHRRAAERGHDQHQ